MNSLYIHIPFCNSICSYCDFTKKFSDMYDFDEYVTNLNKEIRMYNISEVSTIYIGGGTPSVLSCAQLKNINLPKTNSEFSFEMNPEDVNIEKLKTLKEIGVTRISMGVQTINESHLIACNRSHTKKMVIEAIENIKLVGFDLNLDFMFGFKNETIIDVKTNLAFIKKYNNYIDHISYYNLILEDNTNLKNSEFNNDEDFDEVCYYFILKELKLLGFIHYEISNFCKSNKESLHNITYWENNKYFGIGLGASGYINNTRYKNVCSIPKYYQMLNANELPVLESEELDHIDYIYETIMLGLRLRRGVETNFFINNNLDYSKLIKNGKYHTIKEEKIFISNDIILNIIENL